jgi:hypothetical protein
VVAVVVSAEGFEDRIVPLLLSMPLAAAWATTSWLGLAFLSVPLMATTHGALNVLGFGVPAVFAWRRAVIP